jgi:hypothetical protein
MFGVFDSPLERSIQEVNILNGPIHFFNYIMGAFGPNKCRLGPQNDPIISGPKKIVEKLPRWKYIFDPV